MVVIKYSYSTLYFQALYGWLAMPKNCLTKQLIPKKVVVLHFVFQVLWLRERLAYNCEVFSEGLALSQKGGH